MSGLIACSRAPLLEQPAKADAAAEHERAVDAGGDEDGGLVLPDVRLLHFAHVDSGVVQLRPDDDLHTEWARSGEQCGGTACGKETPFHTQFTSNNNNNDGGGADTRGERRGRQEEERERGEEKEGKRKTRSERRERREKRKREREQRKKRKMVVM